MSTTHGCIAQFVTNHLEPAAVCEEENSVERGRRAQMEAWSLKRLLSGLFQRRHAAAQPDGRAAYEAAVRRLSDLSPHLLMDVGVDPETGEVMETTVHVTPRHILGVPVAETPILAAPPAAPAPALAPRKEVLRLRNPLAINLPQAIVAVKA